MSGRITSGLVTNFVNKTGGIVTNMVTGFMSLVTIFGNKVVGFGLATGQAQQVLDFLGLGDGLTDEFQVRVADIAVLIGQLPDLAIFDLHLDFEEIDHLSLQAGRGWRGIHCWDRFGNETLRLVNR